MNPIEYRDARNGRYGQRFGVARNVKHVLSTLADLVDRESNGLFTVYDVGGGAGQAGRCLVSTVVDRHSGAVYFHYDLDPLTDPGENETTRTLDLTSPAAIDVLTRDILQAKPPRIVLMRNILHLFSAEHATHLAKSVIYTLSAGDVVNIAACSIYGRPLLIGKQCTPEPYPDLTKNEASHSMSFFLADNDTYDTPHTEAVCFPAGRQTITRHDPGQTIQLCTGFTPSYFIELAQRTGCEIDIVCIRNHTFPNQWDDPRYPENLEVILQKQ